MERNKNCRPLSEIIYHQSQVGNVGYGLFPESSRPSRPGTSCRRPINFERDFIKKREKEFTYQQTWGNQVKYYEKWNNYNDRYDGWTSPRYYKDHCKVVEDYVKKKSKEENLIIRREKLRKLLEEEQRSFEIELMVRTREQYLSPRWKEVENNPPTSLLREVNQGIKEREEERRRHEAEIKLYHQWRDNNPVVRHHERLRSNRDVKLSWLDQQVEKRMAMEKAEEECKRILAERNKLIEEEKDKEEKLRKEMEERNRKLQEEILKQIEQLHCKKEEEKKLEALEAEESNKRRELLEVEEQRKEEIKKRAAKLNALSNIRQFKMKLKQKAQIIAENLRNDEKLIEELKKSEIAERIEDEVKKRELKKAIDQMFAYTREQIQLEKSREQFLGFVFDSEAKEMFEKQDEIWNAEETARKQLLEDVIASMKAQIEEKIQKNKDRRQKIMEERERIEEDIKENDEQIRRLKEEEERKRIEWKKGIDKQIKEKTLKKKELKLLEQKRIENNLESVRKEEERLMREIADIQRRPYGKCHSGGRSQIFNR